MKKLILALALSLVVAWPVMAQVMPAPRSAPRTPVNREALAEHRAAPPHDVEGKALIIDGERLRVDGADLRLFGIVPPQLSASFGPQARAMLDQLIGGEQSVTCHIMDRDHDGRLLATCRGPNGVDPALELLKRGLAVAARGSIADTELAQPYVAAEQAAETARIGLWSMANAAPAAVPPVATTSPVVIEAPKLDAAKNDTPKADTTTAKSIPTTTSVQPTTASAVMKPTGIATTPDDFKTIEENPGLFARFQILIAGSLMLATTLSILGAIAYRRYTEKRDEMKALAAALRGELQAARAVCLTRIKNIVTEQDDDAATWPRIRATLYQAYVGRLGWLGAELARQIASIYGQASDYASYYNNIAEGDLAAMPKKQALQVLVTHIDEVLPRLASIEQTGQRLIPASYAVTKSITPMPEPPTRSPKPKPAMSMITHEPKATSIVDEPIEPSGMDDMFGESKLLGLVRQLRERFSETSQGSYSHEETVPDYTAIIEDETAHYSYRDEADESVVPNKFGKS